MLTDWCPKSPSVEKHAICRDPVSADPICPLPKSMDSSTFCTCEGGEPARLFSYIQISAFQSEGSNVQESRPTFAQNRCHFGVTPRQHSEIPGSIGRNAAVRPVHLLRVFLLRVLESKSPGDSLSNSTDMRISTP